MVETPCLLETCDRSSARDDGGRTGYCSTHYARVRKHGDPLKDARIKYERHGFSGPKQRRDWHLLYAYGISQEDYDRMYIEQGGACGICGKVTKLVVDHNHATNEVRGLLCRYCNAAMGHFRDDPEMLLRAVEWLHADFAPGINPALPCGVRG